MTYANGWESFHEGERRSRNRKNGLMWLKGWDDAKFGYRRNSSHPNLNPPAEGPNNLARAVDLGYAQ